MRVKRKTHSIEIITECRARSVPPGEILAQQTVGVLVGPSLPGTVRIAEADVDSWVDQEPRVLSHHRSLIPGQRATEMLGEVTDCIGDRVANRIGSMSGQRGTFLVGAFSL
jgi:hypothetical protein